MTDDITTALENVKMGLGDTLRPDVYLADLATIEQAYDEAVAALRARYCPCAWCCASTPPEQRGEAHKRTCQPRLSTPKEPKT